MSVTYDPMKLLSVGNFTQKLCVLCGDLTYLHNLEIFELHHLSFFCGTEGGSCAGLSASPSTFKDEKDEGDVRGSGDGWTGRRMGSARVERRCVDWRL